MKQVDDTGAECGEFLFQLPLTFDDSQAHFSGTKAAQPAGTGGGQLTETEQ